MEADDPRKRLAELVRTRRAQLGLSANRAAKQAKLNRATWTAVEQGTRSVQDQNYAKVEALLGWEPGSIAAILAGGSPTVLAPERPADLRSLPAATQEFIQYLDYVEHHLEAPASVKEELIHRRIRLRMLAEAEDRRVRTRSDG